MSKSKFVFDKLTKLLEQGLITYRDLGEEILNILKSKRTDIVYKSKLASKEEINVLKQRVEILEKEIRKKKSK